MLVNYSRRFCQSSSPGTNVRRDFTKVPETGCVVSPDTVSSVPAGCGRAEED